MMENFSRQQLVLASAGVLASVVAIAFLKTQTQTERRVELKAGDQNLSGVLQVFSTEIFNPQLLTKTEALRKYTQTIGIPNLGNTCYMNSLLQAISGCVPFLDYLERVFQRVTLDEDDQDSYRVFLLIETLRKIRLGQDDALEMVSCLHTMLCDSDADGAFSNLFEQQDCHDLMLYFLDKITTVTAKFVRQRQLSGGLRVSVELLGEMKRSFSLSGSSASTDDLYLTESQALNPEWQLVKSLTQDACGYVMRDQVKANSKIGLNPFASMTCSSIYCQECGLKQQKHSYQLEYSFSLAIPPHKQSTTLQQLLHDHFKAELVSDYRCVQCSIKAHIQEQGNRASPFYHQLLKLKQDLCWDKLNEQRKLFQQRTGIKLDLEIKQVERTITKQTSVMLMPFQRAGCDHFGNPVLDRREVAYPLLLDFKKIGTMMTGRYQLSSVIEHVGIVPQMGHYKAYKRLLPESLNSNAWVEANDDIIQMRQTEEVLARKRGAYLLFYERI